MKKIRIGWGVSSSKDRFIPMIELMKKGHLDYMCLICSDREKTARSRENSKVDEDFIECMETIFSFLQNNDIKIIADFGYANVPKAVEMARDIAKKFRVKDDIRIAGVDVLDVKKIIEKYIDCSLTPPKERELISVDVILGREGIVEALNRNANIVITGSSTAEILATAILSYEFGWDDPNNLSLGVLVGQLLKDGAAVLGGRATVPRIYDIPDLWNIGHPIAEVFEDGTSLITKLDTAGGKIDILSCTEQLLNGIQDPSFVETADVIADFSHVKFEVVEEGKTVLARGVQGHMFTDTNEVSLGYRDGYIALFEISFGGVGNYGRILLSEDILKKRADFIGYGIREWQSTVIGINSLFPSRKIATESQFPELRLRTVARVDKKNDAYTMFYECGTLSVNGPAGGGGRIETYRDVVALQSVFIPKYDISYSLIWANSN
jgi:hypothetical protein